MHRDLLHENANTRRNGLRLAEPPTTGGSEPLRLVRDPNCAGRRQLSALDVQFLNAETARTPMHVGLLTVLDPATAPGGAVTVEALRALIAGRLHLVDALRWRLHIVPLGLDLPYWIDAGSLDLSEHVREVQLPGRGTPGLLADVVARLAAEPLSRSKPLWAAYLINGLSGGKQALYTKVHHAVVDGVSGAEVLAVIFDLAARPPGVAAPVTPMLAERPPAVGEMLQRAVRRGVGLPRRLVGAAGALPQLAAQLAPHTPPRTSFNRRLTARRSFAFTSLPLADVKAAKNSLGCTVNDVVVAVCTTALRHWLAEHDALPTDPLIASIPVSVRTPEQIGAAGNQISFMLAELPTDIADAGTRMRLLTASLAAAKERFHASSPQMLINGSELLPQLMHGLASRALLRAASVGGPPFNLFVSNVAGPQVPLYAAGARVVANYPVSVISDATGGINITVMSYNGMLDVGVIACRDVVPDVWDLAEHMPIALAELSELSAAHRASTARLAGLASARRVAVR
jgi:diacylglycerol O-acyltransferase